MSLMLYQYLYCSFCYPFVAIVIIITTPLFTITLPYLILWQQQQQWFHFILKVFNIDLWVLWYLVWVSLTRVAVMDYCVQTPLSTIKQIGSSLMKVNLVSALQYYLVLAQSYSCIQIYQTWQQVTIHVIIINY